MASNEIRILSLHDYVAIFTERRRWIFATLAVFTALAVLWSAMSTPLYRAEARVRVEPVASSLINDASNVSSNVRERNLQNEVDFAESDRVSERANESFEDEVEAVVSPAIGSDKLIFAAIDADAQRSAQIADTWAGAFVEERTAASGERYDNSLAVINSRLEEIAAERASLKASSATVTESQLAALDRAEAGLREQLNEIGVLVELNQTNSVSILNAAELPTSPFSPNWVLNIALGLIGGLFAGAALSLVLESLDSTIRTRDELSKAMNGSPALASIPLAHASEDPQRANEAIRSLQLRIELGKTSKTKLKTLLVTSANAGEGKSTIASNLAIAYAKGGANVLLIDADLHKPTQHTLFEIAVQPGLADHLEGRQTGTMNHVEVAGSGHLVVLPAGTATEPPSQLLASPTTAILLDKLSNKYDMVIIDSPPLLPVADTLSLGRLADATIFVAKANKTKAGQVSDAIKMLEQVQVTTLGGVLNATEQTDGYSYGYKNDASTTGRGEGRNQLKKAPSPRQMMSA